MRSVRGWLCLWIGFLMFSVFAEHEFSDAQERPEAPSISLAHPFGTCPRRMRFGVLQ